MDLAVVLPHAPRSDSANGGGGEGHLLEGDSDEEDEEKGLEG